MRATTCPPGIANGSVDAAFGLYEAVVRGTTDYFTGALSRQASPADMSLDALNWLTTAVRRERPQWATEHVIVAEWPIARLRDFSDPNPIETIPTLFLPPQAGHDSCIVDYDPQQSQVKTAKDAGLTRVLSLDWVGATQQTKDSSIEDYVAVIAEAIDQLGGRVNLVGDCQGGWLAVIYAALYPESVHTLTIAGAPIDFHAGEPLIHDWLRLMAPFGSIDFYRAMVSSNGGVLPGEMMLNGFKLMQPDAEIDRQLALLAHVHDEKHIQRYQRFEDWFQHTQPIPGAFYLWIVEHLFQNNELLHDTLYVGGRHVDMHEIHCPLYLLAGAKDHITPPAQVFALAEFAATPQDEVWQLTTEGGHLGIFMGHQSLKTCWKPVFESIAARSAHQLHPAQH
jgi:poly(3-hydroxybutyrate) depolymerase